MKKLLALSFVLLALAGAAFAQIPDGFKISAWGRADFVPIQGTFFDADPAQNLAWTGVGSGWGPGRVGINLDYSSERVGARLHLIGDGTTNGGDNIDIWVKPFGTDILKIDVGKFRDGVLRGPGTDGNFQGFVGGPGFDGDAVFNRFEPDGGALFFSKPIPALSVYLQVNPGWETLSALSNAASSKMVDATATWKKLQAGIGYDLEGIGLARVQYVGNTNDIGAASGGKFVFNPATYDGTITNPTGTADVAGWTYVPNVISTINASRIEAAFKFTMISGLTADLGAKIPLPITENEITYMDNIQINLAGSFATGDFGITYGLYSGFGGNVKPDSGDAYNLSPTFNLILVPSYYLAVIDAKVGADLGMKLVGDSSMGSTNNKDGSVILGFGAWVERSLGKGSIKTGVAYQLPKNKFSNDDSKAGGTKGETGYFSLPIILEVSY
jgi:hypothetical protein